MKRKILLVAVLFVLLVGATGVSAGPQKGYDELAPGILGYWIPSGQYCVSDYRNGTETQSGMPFTTCYCSCENDDCKIDPKPVPTPKPEPTPEPTLTPKPEKCNSGRGNNSEGLPDCDPGNSGDHNQGGD